MNVLCLARSKLNARMVLLDAKASREVHFDRLGQAMHRQGILKVASSSALP